MLRRYSASGSEGQSSLCKTRSVSSTSVTPRGNKGADDFSSKVSIASFQHSLKLLGLHPQDFGIKTEPNRPGSHTPTLRAGPTFCTRLKKRSFSLENLKAAIQDSVSNNDGGSGDHLDRQTLSSAVYEEWYFRKLEEARKKRQAELVEEQKKQEYLQKIKMEQKRNIEENFMKWKELKNKQKQHEKQKQNTDIAKDNGLMNGTPRVKQNQEEAFLLWKREKNKQLKQKKTQNDTNRASKEDEEKRSSSQAAFKAWKKQVDETLKEQAKQKEKKAQEEEEEKRRQEQEKRENAELSFRAWKRRKDAELRKRIRDNKFAEELKNDEKLMRESERSYEAEQAFEEWLDKAEERRCKQSKALRQQTKNQFQVPWSPGGSVNW